LPLDVKSVSVDGGQSYAFKVVKTPDQPIESFSSDSIVVQFHPLIAGEYYASVVINSNDYDASPFAYSIKAKATSDEITAVDNGLNKGIVIYPIPIKGDYFYVESQMFKHKNVNVAIFNTEGRKISFRPEAHEDKVMISSEGVMPGVYILEIEVDGEKFKSKILR